jgi:exodeoxyribonuclease VII small subunit
MTTKRRETAQRSAAPDASRAQPGAASFEASLNRLTEVVEKLEGGELGLEESLALFEEGVGLARAAQSRLDAAEQRVEELVRVDENGDPVVKELDPE